MKMRFFFICLMLAMNISSFADSIFVSKDVILTDTIPTDVYVNIAVTNTNITGYKMDVTFPDGVVPEMRGDSMYLSLSYMYSGAFHLKGTHLSGNTYRIVWKSTAAASFRYSQGNLFGMTLKNSSSAEGVFSVTISNVVLTMSDSSEQDVSGTSFKVTVRNMSKDYLQEQLNGLLANVEAYLVNLQAQLQYMNVGDHFFQISLSDNNMETVNSYKLQIKNRMDNIHQRSSVATSTILTKADTATSRSTFVALYNEIQKLNTELESSLSETDMYVSTIEYIADNSPTKTYNFPDESKYWTITTSNASKKSLQMGYKPKYGFVLTSAGRMMFEQVKNDSLRLKDTADHYVVQNKDGSLRAGTQSEASIWKGFYYEYGDLYRFTGPYSELLCSGDSVNSIFTHGYGYFIITESTLTDQQAQENLDAEDATNNVIYYTSSDGKIVTPSASNVFGANIVSNTYQNGQGCITFDGDVTSIGNEAFMNCETLTTITIPNTVTSIGYLSFPSSLSFIIIPKSVGDIDDGALSMGNGTKVLFKNMYPPKIKGKSVTGNVFVPIGAKANYLGDDTWKLLSDWKDLTIIEATLKDDFIFSFVDDTTLAVCGYIGRIDSLTALTIPESATIDSKNYPVRMIYDKAFQGCSNLRNITIPDGVTSIGGSAFEGCKGLSSITIPNSVTSIGYSALYGCTGLTSITIGNSVKSIGGSAFYGCSSLTSVKVKWTTPLSISNYVFDSSTIANDTLYVPKGTLSAYQAANVWKNFGHFVEYDLEEEIPYDEIWYTSANGKTLMGNSNAFGATIVSNTYSEGKGVIKFDGNVTSIGDQAFGKCTDLTSIIIPNTVTSIGNNAFYCCTGLTSITIPYSVTSIDSYAFSNCSSLASIQVDPSNPYYDSRNNCNAIIETSSNTLVAGCNNTIIPNSVTSIGVYAFSERTGLKSITIPNSVTSIGSRAFFGCTGLTSITIPNSVTSIGQAAFSDCSGLISITVNKNTHYNDGNASNCIIETASNTLIAGCMNTVIPNSVTKIGNSAFYGCTGLKSITIPNLVTSIEQSAFYRCSNLTSIIIPNSVITIGQSAFSNCSSLTTATIGNSVTTIDYRAFGYCSSLTSITIPKSVTSIGDYAFSDCKFTLEEFVNKSSLNEVSNKYWSATIYDVIQKDGLCINNNVAVSYRGKPTSITIPNSVTSIGGWAFSSCTSLKAVTIGNSVTTIGSYAFYSCSSLTSVKVKWTTPLSISNYVFNSSTIANDTLYVPKGTLSAYQAANVWKNFGHFVEYDLEEEIPYDEIWYTASKMLTGTISTYSVGLHTNAFNTSISSHTFIDGKGVIKFSGDVTSIGSHAFYGCSGLKSISIPKSVISVGDDAFYGCSSLPVENNLRYADTYLVGAVDKTQSTYTIKEKTKWIGSNAFSGCSSLTSITLPNLVTSIGSYAFYGCSSLTSITIGNSVKSIGGSAFYKCSGLKSITIGNSVKSIGGSAFYDCSSLASIQVNSSNPYYDSRNNCNAIIETASNTLVVGCKNTVIPNSVTSIGYDAFYGCSGLTSITIPNSVTSIESGAFCYCTGLKSIIIPNSMKSIGSFVFGWCSGLTSITLPDSVTFAGEFPFAGCTSLPVENNLRYADTYIVEAVDKTQSTYTIKEKTKWIGSNAFSGCTSLTSITLPNSVTSIEDRAFDNCLGLTSIAIPNSVTNIDNYAFNNCFSLTDVTVSWNIPLSVDAYVFSGLTLSKATLHVPAGTKALYQAADVWKDFGTIKSIEDDCNFFAIDKNGNEIKKVVVAYDDITLRDSYKSLTITQDISNVNVTYKRTFSSSNWQCWYVPFDLELTNNILNNFSFAIVDGAVYTEDDEPYLAFVKVGLGDVIRANTPYVIKAKYPDSSSEQSISADGVTLKATADNGFSVYSSRHQYAFSGFYAQKTKKAGESWYAINNSGSFQQPAEGVVINPFRFSMAITNRSDSPYPAKALPSEVKIRVGGEDGATSQLGVRSEELEAELRSVNLAGQQVSKDFKGIVIKNGKKYLNR